MEIFEKIETFQDYLSYYDEQSLEFIQKPEASSKSIVFICYM